MLGLDEYAAMFESTTIQYFDDQKFFAYAPFTNRVEQIDLNIMEKKAKVIIFDTRTSYVNATQLVEAFKDSAYKRFTDFAKAKHFKECLALVENDLNSNPNIDSKYYKLPCYDSKGKFFSAYYLVRQSIKTDGYAGTYVHPDLIIHILTWCNFALASKISKFITTLFLREGANETITISSKIDEETEALYKDVEEKEKIIDKLESENRYLNDYVESVKFDVVQYYKSISYIADLREENKVLRRALTTASTNTSQMVLLIRHYDKEGTYAYGSKGCKLSLLLINSNDLERYLQKYNKAEPQTQEDLEKNVLRYSTEVVYRVPSLKDVTPDFDQRFISIYEDQIEIWTDEPEKGKSKGIKYIYTTDLDGFTKALAEFCSDWQTV